MSFSVLFMLFCPGFAVCIVFCIGGYVVFFGTVGLAGLLGFLVDTNISVVVVETFFMLRHTCTTFHILFS